MAANEFGLVTRRRFLGLAAGGLGIALIGVACDDDEPAAPPTTATAATTSVATEAAATEAPPTPEAAAEGTVLVGDVLEYALSSDEWAGEFGFVTFRLHAALVDGEPAYFIRTDASDADFASAEQLVFVPKLETALEAAGGLGALYEVAGGVVEQQSILSTAPHRDDYSPLFQIHRVSFTGDAALLDSTEAVGQAEAEGTATVEATGIVVNYPIVKWPGGELPNDEVREAYLGDGQLLEPVDVTNGTVTFKLHACYPNSRYIVTDVTAPPMAAGMNIAPAPGAGPLTEAGATAQILVFGNGIAGSGPMGFQKSVTDTIAGEPAWSPLWDHYTFLWANGGDAKVLKSNAEVVGREEAGALERFPGTPDTNGQLFMVNCPVPVIAPVA